MHEYFCITPAPPDRRLRWMDWDKRSFKPRPGARGAQSVRRLSDNKK